MNKDCKWKYKVPHNTSKSKVKKIGNIIYYIIANPIEIDTEFSVFYEP